MKRRDAHRKARLREALEELYERYNVPAYVSPDPLEFLHFYREPADREVVGLLASSLSFGTVKQIGAMIERVLAPMGEHPAAYVLGAPPRRVARDLRGFKHRWITGEDMAALILSVRRAIERHGSLEACFRSKLSKRDETVVPAMTRFVEEIAGPSNGRRSCAFNSCLLPSPEKKSACKKLNLYLRWMVRRDAVDPGGWEGIPPSKLIVPLDTHMFRMCSELGLTERKQANLAAALEITAGFREIAPEDPVKYDFALTRIGMRGSGEWERLLGRLRLRTA